MDALTLRLSNSEMKLWRRDPRQWYLSTYLGYGPAVEEDANTAISIGNTVHDALAAYYADRIDPVAYADAQLSKEVIAFPTMQDAIEAERSLVLLMLEGYMEWLSEEGADIDLTITGTEQIVEVPLRGSDGGELGITLISKLDAPCFRERDGAKLALEHKTLQDFNDVVAIAKIDTQFLTEHLARFLHAMENGATAEEAYEQCHGILLNMLRKVKRTARAKPPFYGREDVPHNIHELRNHWRHVVSWGTQIQNARDRLDAGESHHTVCPPTPTKDTTWDNPFFKIYAMMDDGTDWMGALQGMFIQRDPLARYVGALPLPSEMSTGTPVTEEEAA